jgi:cobyrinic acid a,c-diamide synthase
VRDVQVLLGEWLLMMSLGSARVRNSFVMVSRHVGLVPAEERDMRAFEISITAVKVAGAIVSWHLLEVTWIELLRMKAQSTDAHRCANCINNSSERYGALTNDDAISILSRVSALRKLRAGIFQVQFSRADHSKQKDCELAGCLQ